MRKAIMSMVVVCALTSLVMAVPTGPGGTIYFQDRVTGGQELYYLDVDSNWDPLITTGGAVVGYATVSVAGAHMGHSGWYHPDTDKQDMAGLHHNGYLLVSASGYNSTPALVKGSGVVQGEDILRVNPDGSFTILNDGVNNSNHQAYDWDTTVLTYTQVVDSGFTPTAKAQGFIAKGNYCDGAFEDSDGDGTVGTTLGEGTYPCEIGGVSKDGVYSACPSGMTVDGQDVTGVWASMRNTSNWTNDSKAGYFNLYKLAGGGYYESFHCSTDYTPDIAPYTGGSWVMAGAGDTDGDGIVDIYYQSSGGIVHAQDSSGDGDYMDAGEVWQTGLGRSWTMKDMQLYQLPSGSWVLLDWRIQTNAYYEVKVLGLDEYGDWDNTSKTILVYRSSTSTGTSGDASLVFAGDQMIWMPLGEAGGPVIPEPTTMLLVGTGVLGLAGVVRRRLLG